MDPPAPTAQADEKPGTSQASAQQQPNTQSAQPATAAETAPTAPTQTTSAIPAPDLSALPQGDLANLSLHGMPADLNLLPMLPQDGSLLSDEQLMNMPLMMPLMMDAGGMLNLPNMPNMAGLAPNNMTNGKRFLFCAHQNHEGSLIRR